MHSNSSSVSALSHYFNNPKRKSAEKNAIWLKKIQSCENNFFSQAIGLREKYQIFSNLKKTYSSKEAKQILSSLNYGKTDWFTRIKEFCSLAIAMLVSIINKRRLIRSLKDVSYKVSPKQNPNFTEPFIYDKEHNTYYKLGRTLGRGGFGTGPNKVKLAEDLQTKERVAVKILRGSSSDLEVEALKKKQKI